MGSFFTNVQLRDVEAAKAAELVRACGLMPSWTLASEHWLGVYPWATEEQNEDDLRTAAKRLSAEAKTTALAVLVHDSDVLVFYVYESGVEVDAYNSCPEYFGGGAKAPTGGELKRLLKLSSASTTEARLKRLLHDLRPYRSALHEIPAELPLVPKLMLGFTKLIASGLLFGMRGRRAVFVDQIVADLALELGIPEAHLCSGFKGLDGAGEGDVPNGERVPPKWVRPS